MIFIRKSFSPLHKAIKEQKQRLLADKARREKEDAERNKAVSNG
ncbi:hypothetical protein [Alteromonas sp. RKMC-009]|nr:hypothetical protein [Alteromonas sp. RKMC-009]